MNRFLHILSIAGSDSSGGAGIQADIKTITSLGGFASTVITCVTAQNSRGVTDIHPIPVKTIEKQLEAIFSDLPIDAVKIGMLNDISTIRAIVKLIKKYKPKHVVIDPVMVAASGAPLIEANALSVLTSELFPLAEIITPNSEECALLLKKEVTTLAEMREAAYTLVKLYPSWVLLKGAHLKHKEIVDILYHPELTEPIEISHPKISTKNIHGAGCTLSSAIALYLGKGKDMQHAVADALNYVFDAIHASKEIEFGHGVGPLCHNYAPISTIKLKEYSK